MAYAPLYERTPSLILGHLTNSTSVTSQLKPPSSMKASHFLTPCQHSLRFCCTLCVSTAITISVFYLLICMFTSPPDPLISGSEGGKCGGFYLRHGWVSELLPLTAILGQTIFQKMGWSLNPWSASRGQAALRESGEKTLPQSHQPEKVTSLSRGEERRVKSGKWASPSHFSPGSGGKVEARGGGDALPSLTPMRKCFKKG